MISTSEQLFPPFLMWCDTLFEMLMILAMAAAL
jgi:hypothetical protein